MNYTYEWCDEEQTSLKRTAEDGSVAFVPTDPGNRDYAAFLAAGASVTAYVAPAAVTPQPTALELLEARVAVLEADHASAMSNMNNNNSGY